MPVSIFSIYQTIFFRKDKTTIFACIRYCYVLLFHVQLDGYHSPVTEYSAVSYRHNYVISFELSNMYACVIAMLKSKVVHTDIAVYS